MKAASLSSFLVVLASIGFGICSEPAQQPIAAKKAPNKCQLACKELSHVLPGSTIHGADAKQELWSLFQARVSPRCMVQPDNAQDIAIALGVVRKFSCHFAVLGGGTSPFKGASNAHGGVTIDLYALNTVKFTSSEKKHVRVGGGAIWADVYRYLDPKNMSAVGTRNSLTGVAGSIIGGGISFFSQAHGWSCDSVTEFEVILANSTILRITDSSHPDLFWALKGGGNNFGIISSLVIEVFPQPSSWYIYRRWDLKVMKSAFEFLVKTAIDMPKEIDMIATTLAYYAPTKQFVVGERMVANEVPDLPDSLPVPDEDGEMSAFLEGYSDKRTTLAMSQKMDSMNREGFYNYFGSSTVKNNVEVFMAVAAIFQEEVAKIADVAGLQVYIVYNPLTVPTIEKMQRHGGNALGLEPSDGPLSIINTNLHWSNASDTPRLQNLMRQLSSRFRQAAKDLDQHHPYIFQNHAFYEEDVFAGYGEQNGRRLWKIRKDVDPKGVFQKLQPGFFKLGYGPEDEEELQRPEIRSEL